VRGLPEPPILVITDRRRARRPLEEVAEAVFAAGCRWLSLREKDMAAASRLALLHRLVAIARAHGAFVTVHEDVAAARAASAAGVHLPAGVAAGPVRDALGAEALIGCSVHGAAELGAASGADYATLSPVFASASKPGYGPALGVGALAAAIGGAPLPVVALGGVEQANAAACIAAEASGIAVMGAVMAADNPAAVMTGLIKTVGAALAARRRTAP
jgi:thiamine-phosphate pyrophosphorylase